MVDMNTTATFRCERGSLWLGYADANERPSAAHKQQGISPAMAVVPG